MVQEILGRSVSKYMRFALGILCVRNLRLSNQIKRMNGKKGKFVCPVLCYLQNNRLFSLVLLLRREDPTSVSFSLVAVKVNFLSCSD